MNFRAFLYKNLFPLARIYWRVFKPKSSGAGCVIRFENKILLIRQTYGKQEWSFPGGGINKNESPEIAAKREVMEEVGIGLKSIRYIGTFISKKYREDTIYVFFAEVDSPLLKIDPGEIKEARWFDIDEIPYLELSFVGKKMLELAKEAFIDYSALSASFPN